VSSNDEPTLDYEKLLITRGYSVVAGVDEAGRGCLAGPIIAGAAILDLSKQIPGLRDSKKLTQKSREGLYIRITEESRAWSIGIVEPADIDKMGIQKANLRALELAVEGLSIEPDYVVADWYANDGFRISWEGVHGGDASLASIAAASILAKVTRDKIMRELACKYPGYGFEKHKGYGAAEHLDAIQILGPSPVHRMSFRPCSSLKLL
jgi:ribonuclease HII